MSSLYQVRSRLDLQTALTGAGGVFLVLALLGLHPALPYLSIAAGSLFAIKTAWASIRERSLDVNLLMVLAAIGAVAVGRATDAAVLLFLFSLSSTLESLAMARTKSAIEGLIKLRPLEATVVRDAEDLRVPVESVALGERVRIRPFEAVPLDGVVLEGSTSVNEATLTGESVPVAKGPGDKVLSGTTNVEGLILVEVTGVVGDSTLDRIVELVAEAQENKASGERVSQWFGQRYTFFVVFASLASLLARAAMGFPWPEAFYQALTLLVALSPCALVISSPASTLSALAWAARNGILVRGGAYIEAAGTIDTVALDKTGTLTSGQPELVEICVCHRTNASEHERCEASAGCWTGSGPLSQEAAALLRLASGAEQYSDHPIADAIVRAARAQGIEVPEATATEVMPGLGVAATINGLRVEIGQARYFDMEALPRAFRDDVAALQAKGMTVALMRAGDRLAGFGLADTVRPEAKQALKALRAAGVKHVVMLTGDNQNTAHAVAAQLGIEDYRAAMLPEDKAHAIQELIAQGKRVMMVGDGINDAPVLKRAHLGVAMGGLGSDVALEAADVVLMRDRLTALAEVVRLGRRARAVITFNLAFAGGVIAVLTLASLVGKLPLPVAVIGHEGSTVIVILNGLRLLAGPGRPATS